MPGNNDAQYPLPLVLTVPQRREESRYSRALSLKAIITLALEQTAESTEES